MTRMVTLLTEGYADWETALLNAVGRSYYQVETAFASPGGRPVTSSGGLRVAPELMLETVDLDALDALVISGGTIWQSAQAPDLGNLLRSAHAKGKIIGLICDATIAAARTGLLDGLAHTSNGDGYLDTTGYAGKTHYRNVPHAVSDRRVITAPATAPVSFMAEIMKALGRTDDNLDFYVGMHGAEHRRAA